MDMKHLAGAAVIASAVALIARAAPLPPLGWYYSTTDESAYDYRTESGESGDGNVAVITSKTANPADFALIEKRIDVTPMQGKVAALNAYVGGEATGTVFVYVRFRDANGKVEDHSRALMMTADHHFTSKNSIQNVLIPPDAVQFDYGVLLQGQGDIRVPSMTFDVRDLSPESRQYQLPSNARVSQSVPSLD